MLKQARQKIDFCDFSLICPICDQELDFLYQYKFGTTNLQLQSLTTQEKWDRAISVLEFCRNCGYKLIRK